jgi:hypothetical protein
VKYLASSKKWDESYLPRVRASEVQSLLTYGRPFISLLPERGKLDGHFPSWSDPLIAISKHDRFPLNTPVQSKPPPFKFLFSEDPDHPNRSSHIVLSSDHHLSLKLPQHPLILPPQYPILSSSFTLTLIPRHFHPHKRLPSLFSIQTDHLISFYRPTITFPSNYLSTHSSSLLNIPFFPHLSH